MCLAIPSKVVEIDEKENMVTVDTMGATRKAALDMMTEPVEIGDYVLLHVGFAIKKIDEESALETLDFYKEYLEKYDEYEE